MKYEKEILNRLVDIYERRLMNSSKMTTKISIKINKDKFPNYFTDTYGYDLAINNLVSKKLIEAKKMKHDDVIESISLNINKIDEIFENLNRETKLDLKTALLKELNKYDDNVLIDFKNMLEDRINNNKSIKQYLDNNYIDAIKAVHYIENLEDDKFERDLSNFIFNDSKRLMSIRRNILSIYNEDSEDFLKRKGVLQVPTYLYIKGEGRVKVNDQIIDLSKVKDSIGICLSDTLSIEFENITKATTIENLTTFYDYQDEGLIIYLGGFASKSQIKILKKLSISIDKLYHFGDIDYGGFSILNNLIEELDINVEGLYMNLDTLIKNSSYLQKYDSDDYKDKLRSLLLNKNLSPYYDAINYLIDNNVWLEQESFYNK